MNIPCRECLNPKSCTYICKVTGKNIETCFHCVVYKELVDNEKIIKGLKNDIVEYKGKADKYDALVKKYAEGLINTAMKVFADTMSLAD